MFTEHQIHEAFGKVKRGVDFPQYVQDLKAIGVTHYDNFVADGKTKKQKNNLYNRLTIGK